MKGGETEAQQEVEVTEEKTFSKLNRKSNHTTGPEDFEVGFDELKPISLSTLQNYVTCALGIHYVGFVMMCFGATNSICSFLFGRLARYTGRAALFTLGKVTDTERPTT